MASSSAAVPSLKYHPSHGKCKYIWDDLTLAARMPLPALVQTADACSFASSTRQAQLNFMIEYDRIGHQVNVEFDHLEWEQNIRRLFPSNESWDPIDLLNLASLGMKNERVAIPVKVGETYLPHWVSTTTQVSGMVPNTYPPQVYTRPNPNLIKHWLLDLRVPLIATVPVVQGYPSESEHPYIGVDYKQKLVLPYHDPNETQKAYRTHSVVLVGVFEPSLENPLKLNTSDIYFIYQGSFLKKSMGNVAKKNFLPCGMTIVSSQLIHKVCFSTNYPPSALMQSVPPNPTVLWDMRRHHTSLLDDQRNAEKIASMWKNLLGL